MPGMNAGDSEMGSAAAARLSRAVLAIGLAAVAATLALRLWLGQGLPLWLDESWTGMIATQSSWSAFWREAWLDCNPPLYYAFMAGWTALAGASDTALRLPSMLFMALAALLPLIVRVPGLGDRGRLGWAVLLCLWLPGMAMAVDARGYALLLLLSVAQGIAFVRLMTHPALGWGWLWASLASLAALTHYHALLLAGIQGLTLLARHKGAALRLWPAALAFMPAFGWLAIHAPRLADYARPDIAWYEPMSAQLGGDFLLYAFGLGNWLLAGLVLTLVAASLWSKAGAEEKPSSDLGIRALALTSLATLLGELVLGSLRPMLTDRYLVPVVPGLLLALILLIRIDRRGGTGRLAGLLLFYALALNPLALRAKLETKTSYGFAAASQSVRQSGAAHLVFSWDHPASRILDAGSLAKLGSFFLTREGAALPTRAVFLRPGEDGNLILNQAAGRDGAVIWIYNRARISAARTYPPMPPHWQGRDCRLERGPWVGTWACGPVRD